MIVLSKANGRTKNEAETNDNANYHEYKQRFELACAHGTYGDKLGTAFAETRVLDSLKESEGAWSSRSNVFGATEEVYE